FAQSGFGKSNLVKLLFSELYRATPLIEKRGGKMEPVGTLIFDRDGEYFWPDDKGRPGLCDVPHLHNHLVVFTDRAAPSEFYGSFVAGGVKLDIRRLPASMVVGAALSPERQEQQNVRKLKGLAPDRWKELVDLVYSDGMNAPLEQISKLLGMGGEGYGDVEANAARSNLHFIIRMLHDPHSRLLDLQERALREGKLCVVDHSRMAGETARIFAGIVLHHLLERNQEEFVKRDARTIPVIAVLEEAQSVLGRGEETAYAPYVRWVKEGRKYDLGSVMITQQPGSIPQELLSQGDVWFVFHLLSAGDLKAVQRANAHYSEDLLSALLNEPIPGHCVFWSSAGGKPYPLPIRVLSFEARYQAQDPHYNTPAAPTYAASLRDSIPGFSANGVDDDAEPAVFPEPAEDYLTQLQQWAIEQLRQDSELRAWVRAGNRITWGDVTRKLRTYIISRDRAIQDAHQMAYNLVPAALVQIFGVRHEAWWSQRDASDGKTIIVLSEEAKERFLNS
ncbi:MAG: DUF87 domain-containing protein, partial [Fimbriimonadales bacterium]|nr:DUF87 domain-containing protein [Fimbriimonadales bacterium]